MKQLFVFVLVIISLFCFSNSNKLKQLQTTKYAGKYSFGDHEKKGSFGSVLVFPESDSTILFVIIVSRGAPSYNSGELFKRMKINNGVGSYYSKYEYQEKGCNFQFTFEKEKLTVIAIDECYECGFGYGVFVDNFYLKTDNNIPEFYIDRHGSKIYFDNEINFIE